MPPVGTCPDMSTESELTGRDTRPRRGPELTGRDTRPRRGRESYWIASTTDLDIPAVAAPADVDVAVLGAGIAGITTAYLLKRAGLTVALIEAGRLAAGVSGHTTAKVTSQHGLHYEHLRHTFGLDTARAYAAGQQQALDWIAAETAALDAPAEFSRRVSFVYSENPSSVHELIKEADTAGAVGLPAGFVEHAPLPFDTGGAVRFDDQAQFHPRRWLLALADTIPGDGSYVLVRTRAAGVAEGDPCIVRTSAGDVRAKHVVVATHYPILDRGLFFTRLEARRDLVVAGLIDPDDAPAGMFISADDDRHSIRTTPAGDRLLLIVGGEPHGVGERTSVRERFERLERWARDRFGVDEFAYRWMAHDLTSVDRLPYIGRLHAGAEKLWVATGFGHWGMTNGTLAGLLLRDLIAGEENPFAALYDPVRINLRRSASRFVAVNAHSAARFAGDRLAALTSRSTDKLAPGTGAVVMLGRRAVAAYRDDDGTTQMLSARCTHLGCLVTFNDGDRTWDCPCHGSRFEVDGTVREGPAVRPLASVNPPDD